MYQRTPSSPFRFNKLLPSFSGEKKKLRNNSFNFDISNGRGLNDGHALEVDKKVKSLKKFLIETVLMRQRFYTEDVFYP